MVGRQLKAFIEQIQELQREEKELKANFLQVKQEEYKNIEAIKHKAALEETKALRRMNAASSALMNKEKRLRAIA